MNDFENRINIVSLFREETPLFLRNAQYYISKKDYQMAIIVLKKGLKKFPRHPAAHILLGKTFLLNRNFELAHSNFKAAADILGSKRIYDYYLNELYKANRNSFNRESFSGKKEELSFLRKNSRVEDRKVQLEESKAVEDRLEQLAEVLSSARIKRINGNSVQSSDVLYRIPEKSKIISETLAKIYLSQGEKSEAIKIYEQLIKKNPSRENYYQEKIKEIKT